jgi:hypothetical protein
MSGRDSSASLHLPVYVVIILCVCALGLGVHFIAEDLMPVTGVTGFDLTIHGEHTQLDHEQDEDFSLFSFLTRLSIEHSIISPETPAETGQSPFSVSPLLPPPNS